MKKNWGFIIISNILIFLFFSSCTNDAPIVQGEEPTFTPIPVQSYMEPVEKVESDQMGGSSNVLPPDEGEDVSILQVDTGSYWQFAYAEEQERDEHDFSLGHHTIILTENSLSIKSTDADRLRYKLPFLYLQLLDMAQDEGWIDGDSSVCFLDVVKKDTIENILRHCFESTSIDGLEFRPEKREDLKQELIAKVEIKDGENNESIYRNTHYFTYALSAYKQILDNGSSDHLKFIFMTDGDFYYGKQEDGKNRPLDVDEVVNFSRVVWALSELEKSEVEIVLLGAERLDEFHRLFWTSIERLPGFMVFGLDDDASSLHSFKDWLSHFFAQTQWGNQANTKLFYPTNAINRMENNSWCIIDSGSYSQNECVFTLSSITSAVQISTIPIYLPNDQGSDSDPKNDQWLKHQKSVTQDNALAMKVKFGTGTAEVGGNEVKKNPATFEVPQTSENHELHITSKMPDGIYLYWVKAEPYRFDIENCGKNNKEVKNLEESQLRFSLRLNDPEICQGICDDGVHEYDWERFFENYRMDLFQSGVDLPIRTFTTVTDNDIAVSSDGIMVINLNDYQGISYDTSRVSYSVKINPIDPSYVSFYDDTLLAGLTKSFYYYPVWDGELPEIRVLSGEEINNSYQINLEIDYIDRKYYASNSGEVKINFSSSNYDEQRCAVAQADLLVEEDDWDSGKCGSNGVFFCSWIEPTDSISEPSKLSIYYGESGNWENYQGCDRLEILWPLEKVLQIEDPEKKETAISGNTWAMTCRLLWKENGDPDEMPYLEIQDCNQELINK